MTQDPQHATRHLQFWIAALAITAINLGVWMVPRPAGTGTGSTRETPTLGIAWSSGSGVLERSGRWEFVLDHEVFPAEQVGRPLARSPFTIEPAIPGVWEVSSPDAFAFLPDEQPPAGNLLRIAADSTHPLLRSWSFDEQTLPVLRFRPLLVETVSLGDVTSPSFPGGPRTATLRVQFNQPVLRSNLLEHLGLEVDGVAAEPRRADDLAGTVHELTIDVRPRSRVTLAIGADLHGQEGLLGLDEEVRRAFEVSPTIELRWMTPRIDWYDRSGSGHTITAHFDRPLAVDQTPVVRVEPDPGAFTTRVSGDRITLAGGFQPGRAYRVVIEPPLMGLDRSLLDDQIVRSVHMPSPSPHIHFEESEGQIVPGGRFEVALRHGGYASAQLLVHRLVDEHLPMVLGRFIANRRIPRAGEVVCDRTIDLPRHASGRGTTMLQLDEYIERRPGVYHVRIKDPNERWTYDDVVLVVSDLTVDLEIGRDSMVAWVTSITTGRPVEGVEVTAWAPNITPLDARVTSADGVARIPLQQEEMEVVTARLGDDVVFLRPRRASGIEDRDLAGPAWPGALDAAIYAERGVHRPGETLHLTAVVRTREGEPVTDTPFEIRWTRPDDRLDHTIEAVTDAVQGMLHADIETDALDATGDWTASLHLPGSDSAVASIDCPVMPFLPVRLRVDATAEPSSGDDTSIRAVVTYLHGAPAADLPGTMISRWTPARFSDRRFRDFTFEAPRPMGIDRSEQAVRTDDLGTAIIVLEPPSGNAIWNLMATVSFQELGGRATSAVVESTVDTQRVHVGLRLPDGRLHKPGVHIPVEVVVFADREVDASNPPTIRLERIDRRWNYVRRDGRWVWNSTETLTPIDADAVFDAVIDDGVQPFAIRPLPDGEYRVTATVPGTPVGSALDFHVSRWQAEGRMAAAARGDRLEIVPDRRTARPGETMPVLVRSPFPGTALVSVETDDIIRSTVVDIAAAGARVDLEIPESARDTAFVSAILVRPLDSERRSWAPLVARGASRIEIDRTPHRLSPLISASSDARPGEVVHTSIVVPEASASAVVHLWAVEEGALLPTGYHAVDPVDVLLRDRRRVVGAISSIANLLPEYDRAIGTDAIGGDAASRRREPVPIRLPETRVIWRQAEVLGDDGRVEVDLTMPTGLDGAMRLMVVSVDGDRYGTTEHLVGVVPAIQIVGALPRTMAPGDQVTVPVTLRNNTAAAADIELRMDPSDRFEVALDTDGIHLEPGATTTVDLGLRPTRLGEAPITLRATTPDGDRISETIMDWQVAVRPPFGFRRDTQRLIVDGGTTRTIERDRRVESFGGTIEVTVSAIPDIDLGPAIQDLVVYPYGCGEQIGSRVEGLLAALTVDPAVAMTDDRTIRSMAASGLGRLWETQGRDGRIPYWAGDSGSDWLTVRTAMLAQRALARDVPVPPNFHEMLTRSVQGIVANDRIERSIRVLGVRALAEAGRPDPVATEMLHLEREGMSLADRAHLAAALTVLGRTDEARIIIDEFTVPIAMPPTDRGRFTSDVTDAATALQVGLEHHPGSGSLAALRDHVATRQGDRRWRTTYETAASVEALAAWASAHPASGDARGTVVVAGHAIAFDGGDPVHVRIPIDPGDAPSDVDRVVSTGDGPLHVVVTTSGVPTEPGATDAVHRGIEVVRRWLDAAGDPIDPATAITAGRTVVVEVSYRSKIGGDLPNVAIVDVLPSGFEIELPTLMTAAGGETALDEVDHAEFRDDRVLVFDTATERPQRFRYVARAVVPGDWTRPGTIAESMYHDAVRSELPLDRVSIELDRGP